MNRRAEAIQELMALVPGAGAYAVGDGCDRAG